MGKIYRDGTIVPSLFGVAGMYVRITGGLEYEYTTACGDYIGW